MLIGEGCSDNVDDGAGRAVRLLLFERGSKAVGAGMTMQAELSRLVDNSGPIREVKYRWGCEFHEEGANDFFHSGSKTERSAFLD